MLDDPIEYLPVTEPHQQHPPGEAVIRFVERNGNIVGVPICDRCHPWQWKEEKRDETGTI